MENTRRQSGLVALPEGSNGNFLRMAVRGLLFSAESNNRRNVVCRRLS
jgi:hypothetical protein